MFSGCVFFSQCPQERFIPFHRSGGMQKNNFSEPENLSLSFTKETPEKTSGRVFFFGATADHAKPQPFCSQLTESKIAKFSRGKGPVAQWLERRSSRLKIAGSDHRRGVVLRNLPALSICGFLGLLRSAAQLLSSQWPNISTY